LEDRNNYSENKKIHPIPALKEFIHFLLAQHTVASSLMIREGKGCLFSEDGRVKTTLGEDGHFHIASPGPLFPITMDPEKEFPIDVAISFAGEDRPVAETMARILNDKFHLNVFYDHDKRLKSLGKDLYDYLYKVYAECSRLCLVLFSRHYLQKVWPRHELKAIRDRIAKDNEENVFLVGLDDCPLPPDFFSISGIKLSATSVDSLCEALNERVWEKKGAVWYMAEDVADYANMENICQVIFGEYFKDYEKGYEGEESLVKIILVLVFLFADHVIPKVKGYFSYLMFNIPEISTCFHDEVYEIFPVGGKMRRHRGLKYVLTVNEEYWGPILEAR
jgi:hypothetical protein